MEPGIIMKVLDAGAYGVICPMVNNARRAAEFVSYMRYPPLGQRSFGPTRVSFAAGADYGAEANKEMLAFAMIETAEGMANLAAIAATPGLDGLYAGPADLTLGLAQGRLPPGFDRRSCVQGKWHLRGASLRHAGVCSPRGPMGLQHDDGLRRFEASCRSGGRQRGEIPHSDRPNSLDD